MPQQERAQATRDRILDAALECFNRSGFDATGVAEVCRQAGVTKGAFYHHFPSKQALFLELLERWLAGLDTQFAGIHSSSSDVPSALRHMATMVPSIFEAARGRIPLFLEFWTRASRDPEVWQATIAPYRRYRQFFSGLLQAGVDEGSLRLRDRETAAGVLVSMAVGLLLQTTLDPEEEGWGKVAQEGLDALLERWSRQAA